MPIGRVYFYLGVVVAVVMLGVALRTFTDRQAEAPAPDGPPKVGEPAKASPGGPFALIDQTGRQVTDQDYRGRYLMVVFGYTYCPDRCLVTMTNMSEAMELLGEQAERVQPLFVTVDPERDSQEQLSEYLKFFHTSFAGLTGDRGNLEPVWRAYGIDTAKVMPAEPSEDAGDYLMKHTEAIFLMKPDGEFIEKLDYATEPEALAIKLIETLAEGS